MLPPTLIREAKQLETIDYQVAPGAAEASAAAVAHIDFQGNRVIWLVDGDSGGRRNRHTFIGAEIPNDRIWTLGGHESGLAVEDLVSEMSS